MSDIAEKIAAKFRSGNSVAVERAVVLRDEWEELIAHIRALEEDRKHNYDCWMESLDRNKELLAELTTLRDHIKRAEEQAMIEQRRTQEQQAVQQGIQPAAPDGAEPQQTTEV